MVGDSFQGVRVPLIQPTITKDLIGEMLKMRPRRCRIVDKSPLRAPTQVGAQHRLNFRFRETFENVLAACPVAHTEVRVGSRGDIYSYLRCDHDGIAQVKVWLAGMERLVVCRDLLAISLALDYDREGGDPDKPHTLVAQQRKVAKPYDRAPNDACYAAANHIAGLMMDAINKVGPFAAADLVIPMPPSSPRKDYDLPRLLAQQIAARSGREDGTAHIRTVRPREQAKNLSLDGKLDALDGTLEVDSGAVIGRTVLLIDDLYQSGASMNFVAMKLQQAGARAILGLAAEKTCRNDDNTPRT